MLQLHVPFCCSSLFLPCFVYLLAYSLYDTCAYMYDLFARAVWEREKKVIESKEREAGRRRWEVTDDSCWHTALTYVGKQAASPIMNCHPAARQLTARIQIQESKLERWGNVCIGSCDFLMLSTLNVCAKLLTVPSLWIKSHHSISIVFV